MNKYLAKSNPKETIQEHTDNLLKNYEIIKRLYPNLAINWDILYLACLYHDIGKINTKFQDKIITKKVYKDEIPHGILSLAFIDTEQLRSKNFNASQIKILAHSIAYHHERDLSYDNKTLDEEINLLQNEIENFNYKKLGHLKVKKLSAKYFAKDRIYQEDNDKDFFHYIMIKGLLNRIDYAASAHIEVEKKNDFLVKSLNNLMKLWQRKSSGIAWNDLQEYMLAHRDDNVIAIAETGMGKTEAGLLWIGDNKGFFTLPLKTAINAMYDRMTKIVNDDIENKVGLLHSDTLSEYLNRSSEEIDIDEYYNKTKQLSLPLTVCTLDQIFDFVYRYRGFEVKLATLAYSKIVIDEVQMYSPDLLAYLIIGLSYITKVGGKFAILTATLPSLVDDLLKGEGIEFIARKTFTNNQRIRHSVKIIKKQLNTEEIVRLYNKNKVLVICNTVKEAQRVFKKLAYEHNLDKVNLFHSNFMKQDRKQKENEILCMGNKDSKEYGIWVTTQVVEASLDIDFDILITELSDLNGLFQRMGRCYRNRVFEGKGYNCYVYDGGDKDCSGVGYVIDKDIFNLSKVALQSINGNLDEESKMGLVNDLYTTEKLKNTEYYRLIKTNIIYVKGIEEYEKSKIEIRKRFRNIHSLTVIPSEVYSKFHEEIQQTISILEQKFSECSDFIEIKELKRRKVFARNVLMNFTLSVPHYRVGDNIKEKITISKYEAIPVLECKYSKEIGVEFINSLDKQKQDNFI